MGECICGFPKIMGTFLGVTIFNEEYSIAGSNYNLGNYHMCS